MAWGGLFFCGKCFFAVVGGVAKMGGVVGGEVVASGTVGARAHVDVVMGGGRLALRRLSMLRADGLPRVGDRRFYRCCRVIRFLAYPR